MKPSDFVNNTDIVFYFPYVTSIGGTVGTVPFLPVGIFQDFYNVKTVNLTASGLQEVFQNSFKGGSNIQTINLSYNLLTSIPTQAFADCVNLVTLNLNYNRIATVSNDAFPTQPSLALLLSYNNLTILEFPQTTSNIKSISVAFNQIAAIEDDFFERLPNLLTLNFGRNNCSSFSITRNVNQTIQSLAAPYILVCYENWKKYAATTTTIAPTTVTTELPPPTNPPVEKKCKFSIVSSFGYTCTLTQISYSSESTNAFTIGGTHLGGLSNTDVVAVFFQKSQLSIVPSVVFDKFVNLSYLVVASTGLIQADENTLKNCGSLKYIDASSNLFITINSNFLNSCANLVTVLLNYNKIYGIAPSSFLNQQKQLKEVGLLSNNCTNSYFFDNNLSQNYLSTVAPSLEQCFANFK